MAKERELVVITKTYDLILWSCNHTGKFPRNHRFVLGERIERGLYDLLELLIRARYNRERRSFLEQANLALAATTSGSRSWWGRLDNEGGQRPSDFRLRLDLVT